MTTLKFARHLLLYSFVSITLNVPTVSASLLTFNGIVDGSPGDPDGIINGLLTFAALGLPGGVTYTGTVQEFVDQNTDFIQLIGTFNNPTAAVVTNATRVQNNHPTFFGVGSLVASINGNLTNAGGAANAAPGERFGLAVRDLSATATTAFATHTAIAGAALPQAAIDFESRNVFVNGPGPLIGDISYTLAPNHSYVFAAGDAELTVSVPEPTTVVLLGIGLIGISLSRQLKCKSRLREKSLEISSFNRSNRGRNHLL